MDAPQVILIPGLLGFKASLGALRLRLQGAGYRARPFARPLVWSPCQYRDLLKQLRAEGPAVVVGYSLGGLIAVLAASAQPELVAGIIGLDPALDGRRVRLAVPYFEARGLESRLLGVARQDALLLWTPHALIPQDRQVQSWVVETVRHRMGCPTVTGVEMGRQSLSPPEAGPPMADAGRQAQYLV